MTTIKLATGTVLRQQLDKEQQKRLKTLYEEAYQEAQKELNKFSAQESVSAQLQTVRLKQLTKELQTIYTTTYASIGASLKTDMTRIAAAVVDDTKSFYASVGLKLGTAYANVPETVVNSIATGKVYQGNWTLSKAIWGDFNSAQSELQTIIAKDLALNKSTLEIAQDIEKFVNPEARKPWDWGKVYPGVRTQVDYNAQRLARTVVSHAYEQSIIQTAQKNPFTQGIKWIASSSHRTCQLCIDRSENDSYGLGAGVFPVSDLPMDHPNGMCTYSVVLTENLSEIADRIAKWVSGSPDKQLDDYYAKNYIAM